MKKLNIPSRQYLPVPQSPLPPGSRLRRRLPRLRLKSFIYFSLTLFSLFCFILYFHEDIGEIPDQWHGPFFNPEPVSSLPSPKSIFSVDDDILQKPHPIDTLIERAESEFSNILSKETHGLSEAARAYRRRRGRHPPPWFDQWVEFAEKNNAVIVEDFFDQIYNDINPFWAVSATDIRAAAGQWAYRIKVRNGTISQTNYKWNFVNQYADLFKRLKGRLPDVDIPINEMDEPRVLVEWEKINFYMSTIDANRKDQDLDDHPLVPTYSTLGKDYKPGDYTFPWAFIGPYWNFVRVGCPRDSYARKTSLDKDFSTPPAFPTQWPNATYMGFVSNFSAARDPCTHPHLRNLHGTFVEPISQSTSNTLLPMFGGSKLPMNNDILLPAAIYWSDEDRFSAGTTRIPWSHKRDAIVWRGSASGGRNRVENWTRFHRHRLLSMLNGTQIEMAEAAEQWLRETGEKIPKVKQPPPKGSEPGTPDVFNYTVPRNFPMPNQKLYPLKAVKLGILADWVRSFSNSAFVWLNCFPGTRRFGCSYSGRFYRRMKPMSLKRQFRYKYLPDVDGNSFSGRYRAFLLSNSLPIKATIYKEWHDERLVAWKHFVPMDNTYMDFYSIMEYLLTHDSKAAKIAEEGRHWAERVLRKEDMVIYAYRLILEYARVSDPQRENMGFVDDLMSQAKR